MPAREAALRRLVPAKRGLVRMLRTALTRHARGGAGPTEARPVPVTVVLTNAFSMGGTIRASLNLAEYLVREGRPVEILSVFRHRDEPFFAFPAGATVTVLQDRRESAPLPRLARVLRRRSSVLMNRAERTYEKWSLLTDVRAARAVRRRRGALIATRPGLNVLLADLAPPAAARIGQEQMHLRAHGRALQQAIAGSYPGLDSVVVLTDTDRRRYAELLSRPTRIEVLPNSVRRLEGPAADLDAKLVFSAGRFSPQKGYDLLIPAYGRIAGPHPDWRLRICGSGPLGGRLAEIVDEHGLGEAVTLAPPARDLGAEMARASIFVLSSRFEGFPLVLLEAMSKGMAVVACDCPTGPSDVIEDGRNGLLVPAKDVQALATAIDRLVADRELRGRLSAGATATAGAFTMEALGPRWRALLDDLAASGPGVAAPKRPLEGSPARFPAGRATDPIH